MQIRFINRHKELEFLNRRYKSNKFELIIIHGRRRIGKSYLIKKFIEGKKSVYLQANQTSPKDQLEQIYVDTSKKLSGYQIKFASIDDYLEYLTRFQNERLVVVFDEFQYLVQSIDGITSILQKWIDNQWIYGKLFIILCGSELRMMEDLLSYQNPLYGRRTGQWKIEPFSIPAVVELFPNLKIKDIFMIMSIFGNIPAYLLHYDVDMNLLENIARTILYEGHPLFEEPLYLLKQEFKEVNRYFSILKAVANGNTRLVDISNATGIEARTLPKYLSNLISTNLLLREIPVGMNKSSNKYVYYHIADQYVRFWFRFVNPHINLLRMDGVNAVLSIISDNIDNYMGYSFERFIIELIKIINIKDLLPDNYSELGRWWKKGIEIDIVGISNSSILCVEVKYGGNINGYREMKKLEDKVNKTLFHNNKVLKMVVANGFNNKCTGCYTLDDLWYNLTNKIKINLFEK